MNGFLKRIQGKASQESEITKKFKWDLFPGRVQMQAMAESAAWQRKLQKARDILRGFGSALVAFSGRTDSTLLLHLAREELGHRAMALLASSPTYPQAELTKARRIASEMGVRCFEVASKELQIPDFPNH